MWKLIKRWWKYLVMRGHLDHERRADPAVQLAQSMQEAAERDNVLREQAAMVLANQRQAQARLDKAIEAYEKAQASAGQALLLADREGRIGHQEKAASFTATAEGFAERMLGIEAEIRELEQSLLTATRAAEKAKANVRENGDRLVHQMREQERLLDELDRAKLQESVNAATQQLTSLIGGDVPSFDEVSKRIHARTYAAEGKAELLAMASSTSLDAQMLEIEKAQRQTAARSELSALREQLGLPAASSPPSLLRPVELVDDEAVTGEL